MRKEKRTSEERGEPEVPPNGPAEPPEADPSGHIPPNAVHTPTPPSTQPSDARYYEKIPKLPGDP